MKSEMKLITPEQAAEWLRPGINRENREIRPTHVAYLAREIEEGRWQSTHQGIAFAMDGRLLDGQHRLSAIVRAGKPIQILVSTELDDEAFTAIDCGMKRANHDRIHLVDDQMQNKLICQAIRSYLSEINKDNNVSVGHIEDEFLTKTDAWMWVGTEFSGIYGRLKKAGIMASFGVYRLVKPAMASAFMDGYRDGTDLVIGSPVLKLRNFALIGTARDCGYWRAQAVMRAHLQGRTLDKVYEAAEDMLGNDNTANVVRERSERTSLGNQTRKRGVAV